MLTYTKCLVGISLFLAAALGSPTAHSHEQSSADFDQMEAEMLYPITTVNTGNPNGSGVVIYSGMHEGEIGTYVITNYHTIEDSLAEGATDHQKKLSVAFHIYEDDSERVGKSTHAVEVVVYDESADLALLKVRGMEHAHPYVANLADEDYSPRIFQWVWAVGAGRGLEVAPTYGIISNLDLILDERSHYVASAQVTGGNSGGGLFAHMWECKCHKMIGIPTMVVVKPETQEEINHMTVAIPIGNVYEFLRDKELWFILGEDPPDKN